ncbi:MAG: methyltransferase regulatory domain-containing protein, partial [Roseomonas sp.]|nr:methyltransferase regulatory domain-containing protein [Roseomonas sp.]
NRYWDPMYFAEMAKQLEAAKVQYVCSSDYLNLLDYVRLTEEHRAFLAEIPDPVFRESVQSFMTNEQFRQDYWLRGAGRMTAPEQAKALRAERLILVFDPSDVFSLVIKTRFSEVTLSEEITRPLIGLMADHKPRSLGEIADALHPKGIALPELVRTLVTLIGSQILAPAQSAEESAAAAKACADLNSYLLNRSLGDGETDYLASPITGGGVRVPRAQQIFLHARELGLNTPAEWARYSFEFMESWVNRLSRMASAWRIPKKG